MDLHELLRALLGEDLDAPCGQHPADLVAAWLGEAHITSLRGSPR
jgi:hypothetical protein